MIDDFCYWLYFIGMNVFNFLTSLRKNVHRRINIVFELSKRKILNQEKMIFNNETQWNPFLRIMSFESLMEKLLFNVRSFIFYVLLKFTKFAGERSHCCLNHCTWNVSTVITNKRQKCYQSPTNFKNSKKRPRK